MAEEAVATEYQIKAAMIVNFAQFVEWPKEAFARPDAPLVIGVMGPTNPFGGVLDQLVAGKTIAGRSIVVKYNPDQDGVAMCHLLFVPAAADGETGRVLQRVNGRAVLGIGDTEPFIRAGGMVRFYTEENKVRFEINPEPAEKSGLKISSKLLKLARIYKR